MHLNVENDVSFTWRIFRLLANSTTSSLISRLCYNKDNCSSPHLPSFTLAFVSLFTLFLLLVISSFHSTFLFNLLESISWHILHNLSCDNCIPRLGEENSKLPQNFCHFPLPHYILTDCSRSGLCWFMSSPMTKIVSIFCIYHISCIYHSTQNSIWQRIGTHWIISGMRWGRMNGCVNRWMMPQKETQYG